LSSSNAGDGGGDARGGNNNDDPVVDVRVHAILQYPSCYDELFSSKSYLDSPIFPIKYGSCAEEEDALDLAVNDTSGGGIGVGGCGASSPSPLLGKDGSWKRSYRALEEMYHHGSLESIKIGDFGPEDMRQLFELDGRAARVPGIAPYAVDARGANRRIGRSRRALPVPRRRIGGAGGEGWRTPRVVRGWSASAPGAADSARRRA
jgi:hypothetical protein